jgi:hypothetical protein
MSVAELRDMTYRSRTRLDVREEVVEKGRDHGPEDGVPDVLELLVVHDQQREDAL